MRLSTVSNTDFAVGTPGYMCPEQARGDEMDHRGDLYSVGVILYELLTGRLPFAGKSTMDVLLAHATEPPPAFALLGAGRLVPPEIEEVVQWCLAKDPADRPNAARELAERFEAALAASEGGRTAATSRRPPRRRGRKPPTLPRSATPQPPPPRRRSSRLRPRPVRTATTRWRRSITWKRGCRKRSPRTSCAASSRTWAAR